MHDAFKKNANKDKEDKYGEFYLVRGVIPRFCRIAAVQNILSDKIASNLWDMCAIYVSRNRYGKFD
jgi:hypothetical protein